MQESIHTPAVKPALFEPGLEKAIEAAASRIMERCDALALCTETPGEITRTFLSPPTREALAKVQSWMTAAGLAVQIDPVGNIIGRSRGEPATGKALVIGSHLDTVPNAGRYDGILGVLAGIAVAELLQSSPLTTTLEVVGFSEEEGVRFAKPYIGSKAFSGKLDPAWLGLRDADSVTLEQAITNFGLDAKKINGEARTSAELAGYVEVHIEQGPVLESRGQPIGIVTAIAGQTRMTILLTGTAGHAGTVPMNLRRDALAAAAQVIAAVESLGKQTIGLVATVGRLTVTPNASNVVASAVEFSLDVRHADDAVRAKAVAAIEAAITRITKERTLTQEVLTRSDFAAVQMDETLTGKLREAAKECALPVSELVSGAGHDAAMLAEITPAAMLFVRNAGGISHNPAESVELADATAALRVMYLFAHRLLTA